MNKMLSNVDLLLLDVDGVLTDGTITYSDSGEQVKNFNACDGLGLRLLMQAGIKVGIITGRESKALGFRCKNLGITLLFAGIKDKANVLEQISSSTGVAIEKMAYAGDDLIDLPVMKRVGVSISVANACPEVKDRSDWVTTRSGGHGAVREICEGLLKAKNLWQSSLDQFLA
jgi:3-deoxy-D-manno-octulosonate 8-phosphate phosphatase (KDO 8-P phosphatase)